MEGQLCYVIKLLHTYRCSPLIENSQLICIADQLAGFFLYEGSIGMEKFKTKIFPELLTKSLIFSNYDKLQCKEL